MRICLLDTGPLVSYLNGTDPSHGEATSCLDQFSGQLCTTSAVITAAMHFVSEEPDGPDLIADFVLSSGLRVYDFCQPQHLGTAAALMRKYGDTPMDFADATLILLAEQLNVLDIVTLDRRGFSIYRTSRGKSFRRVLDLTA